MASWIYNEDEFEEKNYELIPEGVYRVRIEKAEDVVSHSGDKNMIKLTLAVSGYNSRLWSYIILDDSTDENRKRTNQRLGTVFSSFGISDHTMNIQDWEGRVGGAKVRHKKDLQGQDRAEVYYFLYGKDVALLPPWQDKNSQGTIDPDMAGMDEMGIFPAADNPNQIPF